MKEFKTGKPNNAIRKSELEMPKSLQDWTERYKKRQEEFPDSSNEVSFEFIAAPLINLISDMHIGHPSTNYKRIEDEINAISETDNSFVIFAGDLINNMVWNPGQMEEMEQTPEQVGFLRSIFNHLTDKDKLLHSLQGDHDGWLKRSGMDVQTELPEKGVSVSNGPTYFHMDVGDKHYDMGGAHQLPGHSIYNVNHPQMRSVRFGAMHGADVVFSGHNHKKGVAKAYQHELGEPKETTYVALGPYKSKDDWLAKKGWAEQKPEEMFGVSVFLNKDVKEVETDLDIVRANKRMTEEKPSLLKKLFG